MANLRRLIDLDKIKPIEFPSTEMDGLDVVRYLNTLPTVDAVEVVRCADCIRYHSNDEAWGWCGVMPYRMRKKDYCSYGMRKDGGDETD